MKLKHKLITTAAAVLLSAPFTPAMAYDSALLNNIAEFCLSQPKDGDKHTLTVNADGDVTMKLFSRPGVAVDGKFHFTKEEWSGFQLVMPKDSYLENVNFRQCKSELLLAYVERQAAWKPLAIAGAVVVTLAVVNELRDTSIDGGGTSGGGITFKF